MKERVTIIPGDQPFLIVAPHGADDINTGFLAESIATKLEGYAVINRGWKRAAKHDYWADKANCNDVRHCHQDVVKEEFLDPILNYAAKIKKEFDIVYMFTIHGVGNYVARVKGESIDVIVGYGAGNPPSYSCDTDLKNFFLDKMEETGLSAFEGKGDGKFAGKAKNNLNQLFKRWYPDSRVQSMQLEVIKKLRDDRDIVGYTAEAIAVVIENLVDFDDTCKLRTHKARGKI